MTLANRRLLSYVATLVAITLFALSIPHMHVESNPSFHINISIVSAMISVFTGSLAMVRYYARRNCPYLWIGIAFLGNGIIEMTYAYVLSFFSLFQIIDGESFMLWGWWLGRLYLSIMLMGAYLTCTSTNSKPKEREAYILAVILLTLFLSILFLVKLPTTILGGTVSRPLELIPGILMVATMYGFYKTNMWKDSTFTHWFIKALIICAGVQLFIVLFSSKIYDTRFMTGNLLRTVTYLFVLIGLHAEIFKLYRSAKDEAMSLSVLRLAINQITDYAVFMLDVDGHIITWNKGAERIYGYTTEEIKGRHFSNFYSEDDNDAKKPQIELEGAIAHGHHIDEGWRIRQDDTKLWAYVIITPIYNEMNQLIGFSKITRDLTEQKEHQEELHRTNLQLTQSNQQLQQFTYIATHDLKEPLRSISSFTELLIRECKDVGERGEQFAGFIYKAVERTRKLLDDLRIYTSIGMRQTEQTTVNLNQCLTDALNMLKRKIDDNNTVINRVNLPTVRASSSQLMYVFMHLIDNAIKYRKPDVQPVINIGCETKDGEYIFSIGDNGIGIPKEYEEKIFTIFQKLVAKEKTEGSGIGLSICKQVVTLYGGRIWFDSSPKGTTFYFSLPMEIGQESAT